MKDTIIITTPQEAPEGYGVCDQDHNAPKTINLNGYHRALLRGSGGEIDVLASMIMDDLDNLIPDAFELVKKASDKVTDEAVIEAAELLINSNK